MPLICLGDLDAQHAGRFGPNSHGKDAMRAFFIRCISLLSLLLVAITASVAQADQPMSAGGVERVGASKPVAPNEAVAEKATSRKVDYQPNWPEPPSLGSVLARLAFGTVVVLILCGGTMWFGRSWIAKHQGILTSAGKELRLIESTRVGGHCCVHLLQVGNQRIIVGTDRTGLHSVVPLPESFSSVLDDQLEATPRVATTRPSSVSEALRPEDFGVFESLSLIPKTSSAVPASRAS